MTKEKERNTPDENYALARRTAKDVINLSLNIEEMLIRGEQEKAMLELRKARREWVLQFPELKKKW